MPAPSGDALRVGERYGVGLAFEPRRGQQGERLGRGTGSSIEFQDRRHYAPGDDVRHIDWRAYARTDALVVRQYREEILPNIEILVDTSRSMAVDEAKARLAIDLPAVLGIAARGQGFRATLVTLGARPDRIGVESYLARGAELDSDRPLVDVLREAHALVRPGSLRVLVSDFLTPHVARDLVRSVSRGAGGLALVQVLATGDADPPRDVATRMTDSENGEALDLVVDGRVRERYLARLERLTEALAEEARGHGASFVRVVADASLERICRDRLADSGLLVPV